MKKTKPKNITIAPPLLPDVTVVIKDVKKKKKYRNFVINFFSDSDSPRNINPAGIESEQNIIYETVKPSMVCLDVEYDKFLLKSKI